MVKETLLFDMDGLLLDTERLSRDAFLASTARLGLSRATDEAFFLTLVGGSSAHTRQRLSEYLPAEIAPQAIVTAWLEEMAQRTQHHVPLRPHVAEVLQALEAKGHRLAVVTSTWKKNALHHLENAGILPHFDHVTGGDEVSASKPDPAPYRETASVLGVDVTSAFAFEDSDRGIAAAVAAGCVATQIPDLRPAHLPLPDLGQHVAEDLFRAIKHLGLL